MNNLIQNQGSLGLSSEVLIGFGVAFIIIMIGMVILKGVSLWNAAKRGEKWWFIILLVINTFGILEMIYLTWVAKIWHRRS